MHIVLSRVSVLSTEQNKKGKLHIITLINLGATILLIISENIMPVMYKKNNISYSFGDLISF